MKKAVISCLAAIGIFLIMVMTIACIQKPSNTTGTNDETGLKQVVYVELIEAVQAGLVEVNAVGTSYMSSIEISLTSNTEDNLEVTILPGTIFTSPEIGVQSMLIIVQKVVSLDSYEVTEPFEIATACFDMELIVPEKSNSLVLSTEAPPEEIVKLLNISAFHTKSNRIKQFAIWTITENPKRKDYVFIAAGRVFGMGPTDEEMQAIQLLFEEAGIATANYQAFWPEDEYADH